MAAYEWFDNMSVSQISNKEKNKQKESGGSNNKKTILWSFNFVLPLYFFAFSSWFFRSSVLYLVSDFIFFYMLWCISYSFTFVSICYWIIKKKLISFFSNVYFLVGLYGFLKFIVFVFGFVWNKGESQISGCYGTLLLFALDVLAEIWCWSANKKLCLLRFHLFYRKMIYRKYFTHFRMFDMT